MIGRWQTDARTEPRVSGRFCALFPHEEIFIVFPVRYLRKISFRAQLTEVQLQTRPHVFSTVNQSENSRPRLWRIDYLGFTLQH